MADLGAIAERSLLTYVSDPLTSEWVFNDAERALMTYGMILDGIHGPLWENNGADRSLQTYGSTATTDIIFEVATINSVITVVSTLTSEAGPVTPPTNGGQPFGICPPGPTTEAAYTNFAGQFCYACDMPDKGGQWNDFAPNANPDHHWIFQFTLAAMTEIRRLEIYQLDSTGLWTTGKAWSTGNPIFPYEDDPTDSFEVFPLLIFIAAVQQFGSYQTTLGNYGAGSHTWDLYGDMPGAGSGYFRLKTFLGNGNVIQQTITATCTASCTTCAPPATPTVAGVCAGKLDVTFTGPVGRDFVIFYKSDTCSTGLWIEGATGTIDASPKTVQLTGLVKGCTYSVYVSIDISGCGFKDSAIATGFTPLDPVVTVATNKLVVNPNESFTISWTSTNLHTTACGGCLAGEIKTPFGCKPGNTSDSQITSLAGPCGPNVFEVSGCNPCGSAIATVTVTVNCVASCSGPQADIVRISNHLNLFGAECADVAGCLSLECEVCTPAVVWDGTVFHTEDSNPPDFICSYTSFIGDCLGNQAMFGCTYTENCGGNLCMYAFGRANIDFRPSTLKWELEITSCTHLLWFGEKTTGNNATGVYTKTGGCAAGPATITVTL